ncbi:MAG: cupin domain-containing protein [Acidobacteriota bacterium]|nr:cupin domain-containing protein [Acidobacteriota bacterium]
MVFKSLGNAFFKKYWRRKPLYLKGGAKALSTVDMSREQFLDSCKRLETHRPELVYREGERVVFAQKLDLVESRLQGVIQDTERALSGCSLWFDGVLAEDGLGIGSHYDIADTLLLQQRGVKIWRLHDPRFISDVETRARLLNETRVDAMYMPDGYKEYVLEPGDLLYLPLLWVHWGLSRGPSVSLSLAMTSRNPLQWLFAAWSACLPESSSEMSISTLSGWIASMENRRVLSETWFGLLYGRDPGEEQNDEANGTGAVRIFARLKQRLYNNPVWWRPVPIIRENDGGNSRHSAEKHLEELIDLLVGIVDDEATAQSFPKVEKPGLDLGKPLRGVLPVGMFQSAGFPELEALDSEFVSRHDMRETAVHARRHEARLTVQRFFLAARYIYAYMPGGSAGSFLAVVERAASDPGFSHELSADPFLQAWVTRAAQALEFRYVPRIREVGEHLPGLMDGQTETKPDKPVLFQWNGESLEPVNRTCQAWYFEFQPGNGNIPILSGDNVYLEELEERAAELNQIYQEASCCGDRLLMGLCVERSPSIASHAMFPGLVFLDALRPDNWASTVRREGRRRVAYALLNTMPLFEINRFAHFPFADYSKGPQLWFHRWFSLCGEEADAAIYAGKLRTSKHLTDPGRRLLDKVPCKIS